MLTTLFHIPSRIPCGAWSLPLFGFGVLLAVVVAAGAVLLATTAARQGWRVAASAMGGPLLVAAALVAQLRLRWSVLQLIGVAVALGVARALILGLWR